jgi:hypothetical protein
MCILVSKICRCARYVCNLSRASNVFRRTKNGRDMCETL